MNTPVEVSTGRWVERGFIVTGGVSEGSGSLLDDTWLFDLTNLGAASCPWVDMGSSGAGRSSASLSWDPTRQRFLLAGGYTETSAAECTDDSILTTTIDDLADGLGWTLASSVLPERTVTTSSLADASSTWAPWPVLDCSPSARNAPCEMTMSASDFITWIASSMASGSPCSGPAGTFNADEYVTEMGMADPRSDTVDCESGLSPENVWYIESCADDPYNLTGGDDAWMAYDSASAPGVAEAATAFDPVTGEAWIHGGTTGCDGTCGEWTDVAALDLSGDVNVALANDDELVLVTGTTASAEGAVHPGAVASAQVPPDTSYGRRAASGAWVGVDWDFAAGDFTGAGWMVAVGGTRHHALGNGRQHELLCEDEDGNDMNLCGYCVATSDTWVEGDPAYVDLEDGLLTGAMVISVLQPGGSWDGQSDAGSRVYAATTWFGGDEVLVWGGSGTTGSKTT